MLTILALIIVLSSIKLGLTIYWAWKNHVEQNRIIDAHNRTMVICKQIQDSQVIYDEANYQERLTTPEKWIHPDKWRD